MSVPGTSVRVGWITGLAMLAAAGPAAEPVQVRDPLVSVWYRGAPAGVPRQDDLAAIRAHGFSGVTWPVAFASAAAEVQTMAAVVGLTVLIGLDTPPLTPATALAPDDHVDIRITAVTTGHLSALAWRAVAHGARAISFDSGEATGAGLNDASGRPRPWVAPAAAVARQFTFNRSLIAALRPGPPVRIADPGPDGLDVVLLDAGRSWVLVATNTAAWRIRAVAALPPGVPAALWVDLLDASEMSMRSRPGGAEWTFELDAGSARVYAIDKRGVPSDNGERTP